MILKTLNFLSCNSYKKNILYANLFSLTLSIIICTFTFYSVKSNEFLLIHDHSTYISKIHLFNNSFIRNMDSGGFAFGIQSAMYLPNRIIYSFLFSFGFSVKIIQFFTFTLFLYIFQSLSFLGFYKIYNYKKTSLCSISDFLNVSIATLFYCFGFLTILYMNTGPFWSLNFVLSYSLFPLTFYYIQKLFDKRTLSIIEVIFLGMILLAVASYISFFVPLLVAIFVFLLSKYSAIDYIRLNLKRIVMLAVIFMLLFFYFFLMYIFEIHYNSENVIKMSLVDSTAEHIRGEMLYMFLNYFSWALYTVWEPRSILSFFQYYLSYIYQLAFLSVYSVILFFSIRSKEIFKNSYPYFAILLISLFFAKGPLPPFGFIYEYLITHFPLFLVVRSPDAKFGIGVVFAIATLILFILRHLRGTKLLKYLSCYFLIVIIIASFPLFAGKVILGENIPNKSGNFVSSVLPEYKEVLNILNQDKEISNVLIYQPSNRPNLIHDNQISLCVKDTLRAESHKPFLYLTHPLLTNANLFNQLQNIYKKFDFEQIKNLNIRYIIIRKDAYKDRHAKDINKFKTELLKSNVSVQIWNNRYLELYRVKNNYYTHRIFLEKNDSALSFFYISPVKYLVEINNICDRNQLLFLESYNKHWNIYPLKFKLSNKAGSIFSDLSYLHKDTVFDSSHKTVYGFANKWEIDPDFIVEHYGSDYYETNPNGSKNMKFLLYYKPQSYFYFGVLVSGGTLLLLILYLIYNFAKNKIKNKSKYVEK